MVELLHHNDTADLLASYAVDAVDAQEHEAITAHLTDCAHCRLAVDEYRATCALLTEDAPPAGSAVWATVQTELEADAHVPASFDNSAHPDADRLAVYAVDALDEDEHADIDAHLPTCDTCRLLVDEFLTTTGSLTEDTAPASQHVWQALAKRMRETDEWKAPSLTHDATHDLLGVYVLDAVDDEERQGIEAHVAECPICAGEVDQFRTTLASLTQDAEADEIEFWDRLSEHLGARDVAPVVNLADGRARRTQRRPLPRVAVDTLRQPRVWVSTLAAAAALVLLVVIAARVLAPPAGLRERVDAAFADPDATVVDLSSATTEARATVAVLPDGNGYVQAEGFAELPRGKTYELWAYADGQPAPAAELGGDPSLAEFEASPATQAFTVTVEAADAISVPTGEPVVAGITVPPGTFEPDEPLDISVDEGLQVTCDILARVLDIGIDDTPGARALSTPDIAERVDATFDVKPDDAADLAAQVRDRLAATADTDVAGVLAQPFCVITPGRA